MICGFTLPAQVLLVLERLERCGFEAYIVGGCVRDMLMGSAPADYDVATSALPEQTAECMADFGINTANMKHGTVVAAVDGMNIEITTYRVDGSYGDMRHPDSVSFTRSIREDLARRDFTVNAVAFHPVRRLIDPFGGQRDIDARLIRCVGEPETRFSEDALRIMRALRFRSALNFEIEENTAAAVRSCKELLREISAERLAAELSKLICGKNPFDALVAYPEVIGVFIPEVLPCVGFEQHSRYHVFDVWGHIAKAVAAAENDEVIRLCALLHDIGKPRCYTEDADGTGHFKGHASVSAEMSEIILRRLRYPDAVVKSVRSIIYRHSLEQMNEKSIRRRLCEMGETDFFRLLALRRADNSAKTEFCLSRLDDIEAIRLKAEEIIREGQCFSLRQLAVNGNDIKALGFREKEIGAALSLLLQRVLDGELENDRNALLRFLDSEKEVE